VVKNSMENYFIVRTSWVFGEGCNFVNNIREQGKFKSVFSVVDDQIGSPTFVDDLVEYLIRLCNTNSYGVYHVANSGYCSRYELASKVVQILKLKSQVIPVGSSSFPCVASRPRNSSLCTDKLLSVGLPLLPYWGNSLRKYLLDYNN